jgi:hypothetical protein
MARMKKAGGGMIRLMTILLWAVFAAGPAAAAESWTGQWQIT